MNERNHNVSTARAARMAAFDKHMQAMREKCTWQVFLFDPIALDGGCVCHVQILGSNGVESIFRVLFVNETEAENDKSVTKILHLVRKLERDEKKAFLNGNTAQNQQTCFTSQSLLKFILQRAATFAIGKCDESDNSVAAAANNFGSQLIALLQKEAISKN